VIWALLFFVMIKGTVIEGANASRWLQVPIIGITFQPSTVAALLLYLFVARYLAKTHTENPSFQSSVLKLWVPVFITLILILPSNFSTAALIFLMVLMLVFVGHYPLKYIAIIVVSGMLFLTFFFVLVKAFPDAFPNRVDTWLSRVESFRNNKPNIDDDYQIEKAKIAIASGGVYGLGPGKSVQRNFLPQSSSDFIFAIIVEENGLLGALVILLIYLLLFFRFIIGARKSKTLFGKLVIVGLGFPIIFQALLNMMVAVQLIPVTGQTLPLISSGGSSIWVTCVALGIILSVTKKDEEIALEETNKQKRDEALQKLIDKQLQDDEDDNYSISENPILAVVGKK
ncbi:MAG: FtsW/RodA/SpoVE family cell cycle protein, partial [Flavobacterium sp.]|nr:FtsW/RodA/SpoVE family cell cycle protein [Flavobacterium sp.]